MDSVTSINPQVRMQTLITNWRKAPLPEVLIRYRALCWMDEMGHHMSTPVFEAWLQMRAVIELANSKELVCSTKRATRPPMPRRGLQDMIF